jgi:hypothetical protein
MRHVPFKRALCAGSALFCFAAAFVLTPSDVRSQGADAPPAAIAEAAPTLAPPLVPVAPLRDVFVPGSDIDDAAAPTRLQAALVAPRPPQTSSSAPVIVAPLRVSAISTGVHPIAVIDVNGSAQVLTIGDAVAGTRVAAILSDAVRLADGRRLELVTGSALP